ncbi:MAG TPA: cytochrome P450 [Pseudonocardia sp.]
MPTTRDFDQLDISSHAFWAKPPAERDEAFAELRRRAPISWHRPAETDLMPNPDDPGFWALTRNADIVEASRKADVFASGQEFGGVMLEDIPPDVAEAAHSILAMDDPRHLRQRKLISSVFTPKRVAKIEEQIRHQASRVVDGVASAGEIDFVDRVASRLPMWTISEMIGIEEADRTTVADAANSMVGWNDPEFIGDGQPLEVLFKALTTLHGAASELAGKRREEPADDLMTALVRAELDGQRLTDPEIAAFFVLLCVAGNDTTRQTSSHTIKALCDHPEQREALVADYDGRIGTAVEEFVRWASPVLTFRRTARADTEVGGQKIAQGEKVVMFYRSGNQDESVFDRPLRFDISRTPNNHVGFGGGGRHFCLGSHLAKTQLRALFRELLTRLPDLEAGQPEYLAGNFINGIKRLPARFTPLG